MSAPMILGVTGVSGGGKTTVTRILARHGAYVVIADELSHNAILRGGALYDKVLEAFGAEILRGDLEIDRGKLGRVVFGSPRRMRELEGIIHPHVIALTDKLITEAMATGEYGFAVIDAPMLIEAGMHEHCDRVWLVTAPDELKIKRITARDGITRQAAEKRLAARDEAALISFADEVIVNDGSFDELERTVLKRLGKPNG